jgi:hypothetical protein
MPMHRSRVDAGDDLREAIDAARVSFDMAMRRSAARRSGGIDTQTDRGETVGDTAGCCRAMSMPSCTAPSARSG